MCAVIVGRCLSFHPPGSGTSFAPPKCLKNEMALEWTLYKYKDISCVPVSQMIWICPVVHVVLFEESSRRQPAKKIQLTMKSVIDSKFQFSYPQAFSVSKFHVPTGPVWGSGGGQLLPPGSGMSFAPPKCLRKWKGTRVDVTFIDKYGFCTCLSGHLNLPPCPCCSLEDSAVGSSSSSLHWRLYPVRHRWGTLANFHCN